MKASTRRVLGIDPGFGRLGWAIIEGTSSRPRLIQSGCIETKPSYAPERRIVIVYKELQKIVARWKPTQVGIEKLFFQRNVSTAIGVGQARGVVLLICGQHDVPVFEYTPTDIKLAATGYGRADKRQLARMMKTLLGLTALPRQDDEVDAMAVALCGLTRRTVYAA